MHGLKGPGSTSRTACSTSRRTGCSACGRGASPKPRDATTWARWRWWRQRMHRPRPGRPRSRSEVMDSTASLAFFGTAQPVPPVRRLAAGALSCEFSEGGLRDVRWHGVEIVRGISYLFRDRDWGTAASSVHGLVVDESDESFSLRFELRVVTAAGVLHGDARVHGRSDGQLVFEVEATTGTALETNRCGFVVLHPASAAGRPV